MNLNDVNDDEVLSGQHYWILIKGPGSESTHDWFEIGLPYRDEHGQIVFWEMLGTRILHSRVRRVVQLIPYPQL